MKKAIFLFIAACLMNLATTTTVAANEETVVTYAVGTYMVSTLSEGGGKGSAELLSGVTDEAMKKFLPDGTFDIQTNAFLVRTGNKNILVDTGYGRNLFDNLRSLGVSEDKIDVILLTHMHGDHIGGLLRDGKPAFPNAKIVLAIPERDHWMAAAAPDTPQKKVLAAYSESLRLITPNTLDEIAAGKPSQRESQPGTITSTVIAAYGHTPGHVMFQIEADGKRLLIWGDLTHAMAVQMPYPSVAVTYDVDPAQAVQSRLAVLEYAAKNRIPVAGMHIAYPGIGTVAKKADGYSFTPAAR